MVVLVITLNKKKLYRTFFKSINLDSFQFLCYIFEALFQFTRQQFSMNDAPVTDHVTISRCHPSQGLMNLEEDTIPNHRNGKAKGTKIFLQADISYSAKSLVVPRP